MFFTKIFRHSGSSTIEEHIIQDLEPGLGWYWPAGHNLQNASFSSLNVCFGHKTKKKKEVLH